MSGYHKIIAHRPPTTDELDAILNLICEDYFADGFATTSGGIVPTDEPTFGFIYHIGFPPDEEQEQCFNDSEDGHTIVAWGFITDDEPCGFGEQLFGWGHNHTLTCQEVWTESSK